jgi:hypothetical protein
MYRQRDRTVVGTRSAALDVKMSTAWGGGSSSVFNKQLAAPIDAVSTSGTTATRRGASAGARARIR